MPQLSTLLVQIGVIIVTARLVGWLFQRLRQPQVIGEMVAGIVLGPSLLGWLAPGVSATLFPADSLGFLNALSQIGLLVFMFLIGLELDPQLLHERGRTALITSTASILVPFVLGAGLAVYLYPFFADRSVNPLHFALFVGTAMSVTAFPVLARILSERGLLRTEVGTVAIASAAVGDVSAWCILAGVVALVRAAEGQVPFWVTLGGALAFTVLMLGGVRRLLIGLEFLFQLHGKLTNGILAIVLAVVLASAWATEWLGVHALFGAFLAGAVMPRERHFVHALAEKLEGMTVVLLLPLFFAFTGLRTSLGLVGSADLWVCVLVIGIAILGKFAGSALAARLSGMPWREAGAIGVLMNTRGLVELVVLNIGLDIGVLSPTLFAMLVLMALATTFMTTPLLEWMYVRPLQRQRQRLGSAVQAESSLI